MRIRKLLKYAFPRKRETNPYQKRVGPEALNMSVDLLKLKQSKLQHFRDNVDLKGQLGSQDRLINQNEFG